MLAAWPACYLSVWFTSLKLVRSGLASCLTDQLVGCIAGWFTVRLVADSGRMRTVRHGKLCSRKTSGGCACSGRRTSRTSSSWLPRWRTKKPSR